MQLQEFVKQFETDAKMMNVALSLILALGKVSGYH